MMDFEWFILLALLPLVLPDRAQGAGAAVAIGAGIVVAMIGVVGAWSDAPSWGAWVPNFDAIGALFAAVFCVTFAAVVPAATRRGRIETNMRGVHLMILVGLFYALIGVLEAQSAYAFLFYWELMGAMLVVGVSLGSARRDVLHSAIGLAVVLHAGFFVLLFAFFSLPSSFSLWGAGPMSLGVWVLFLIPFLLKSGVFPFHFWLPSAYRSAPTWVSAAMGGAATNIGLYGLIRITQTVGAVETCSFVLMILGGASALLGALRLPVVRDLKGVGAYSSMVHLGLVVFALGLGYFAKGVGAPTLAWGAFASALVMWVFHAVGKALYFLTLTPLVEATGTDRTSALGGLVTTMPRTTGFAALAIGSLMGLVPLGGFWGEWGLLNALLEGVGGSAVGTGTIVVSGVGLLLVALVGAVGIFAWAKSFSVAFLGQARTRSAALARDTHSKGDWWSMILLGLVVVGSVAAVGPLSRAAGAWFGVEGTGEALLEGVWGVATVAGVCVVLVAGLWVVRRRILAGREVRVEPTWACGQGAPEPENQYTDRSLAREALVTFSLPASQERADRRRSATRWIAPMHLMRRLTARLAFLQTGQVGHYVLHIVLFLTLVLFFTLFGLL